MATTRAAGVAMQLLSIPFIAVGFPVGLFLLMGAISDPSTASSPDFLKGTAISIFLLLIGGWLLFSGKRAARLTRARQ